MFEYFTENVETIADGIWHLQKVDDFPAMFRWINAKWVMAIPGVGNATGPPPTAEAVRRVMKRDWSFVREMRIGEYGICNICLELQERRDDGFRTDRDAEEWKAANACIIKFTKLIEKRMFVEHIRQLSAPSGCPVIL
eukprot:g11215.t1